MAKETINNMEGMKLEIRRYEPADEENLFRLHKKALAAIGVSYVGHDDIVDGDLKNIENVYNYLQR